MIKRLKPKIVISISLLAIFTITVIGLNASPSYNDKDVEAIKDVIEKASILADRAYIDAKKVLRIKS
jgi:hypothetical protein